LLEESSDDDSIGNTTNENNIELSTPETSQKSEPQEELDTHDQIQSETIQTDLAVDQQWEDWGYVSQGVSSAPRSNDENSSMDYQGETSESLRQQLQWQIDMMPLSDTDKAIATILIDSIDERGYLNVELEEVAEMLQDESAGEIQSNSIEASEDVIGIAEVETLMHLLQSFEPAGIAARSLQECLILQLNRIGQTDSPHQLAKKIIEQEFNNLSSRNYRQITKAMNVSDDELKKAVAIIQSLDPRPGNVLSENTAEYITPDVYVKKNSQGIWEANLNPNCSPKLAINQSYASLIKRADNSEQNQYLKNNLQDAKWFLKSLQSRNDTLLKVASCIVEKQSGFFDYGPEAMKPLVLNDIAQEVDMHESTISRVTTQKYMHTPRGVFELKYFFSSHLGTTSGGECSSTAIKAVIKKLVAEENHKKPLSDSKLANLLQDQGIKVARRTVAKYREALSIPPSNERKELF
jgi:RNA polymerase sigma-54 factor